jgi:hypothetical protein
MQRINIDWETLCLNLRRHKPLAQIAREIDCDEQTINRLQRGEVREPRFSVAIELLNMHLDLLGAEKHRSILK